MVDVCCPTILADEPWHESDEGTVPPGASTSRTSTASTSQSPRERPQHARNRLATTRGQVVGRSLRTTTRAQATDDLRSVTGLGHAFLSSATSEARSTATSPAFLLVLERFGQAQPRGAPGGQDRGHHAGGDRDGHRPAPIQVPSPRSRRQADGLGSTCLRLAPVRPTHLALSRLPGGYLLVILVPERPVATTERLQTSSNESAGAGRPPATVPALAGPPAHGGHRDGMDRRASAGRVRRPGRAGGARAQAEQGPPADLKRSRR